MMPPDQVKAQLLQSFDDAQIDLIDLTGTQDHYECHIASARFAGLLPMAQHRLVYQALEQAMKGPIHALSLKTYTPEAWQRRKA